jgi:N-acetylglucosaminyldiphosphoundecaprenol N-acetyl-beta-D-mannosaminyltransferase
MSQFRGNQASKRALVVAGPTPVAPRGEVTRTPIPLPLFNRVDAAAVIDPAPRGPSRFRGPVAQRPPRTVPPAEWGLVSERPATAPGESRVPRLTILGVPVAQLTVEQALAELARLHDFAAPAGVAFVNAHTLNLASRSPDFRAVLCGLSLVLNDGAGVSLAARFQGRRFPANLNGTDLTPRLLAMCADRGWEVYLLGGKPGITERAAHALVARIPGLRMAGFRDGYFTPDELPEVLAGIRSSGASVLLVAMGNPLQESWLAAHLKDTGCRLALGVGGFVDFAAGHVPRAPGWMRAVGLEWLYRMSREPGRLWRRYVLGNPAFITRVLIERLRR